MNPLVGIALAATLTAGCRIVADRTTVAAAAGQTLTAADLNQYLDLLPVGYDRLAAGHALAQGWIDLTLAAAAVRRGLDPADTALQRRALEPLVRAEHLGRFRNVLASRRPPLTKAAILSAIAADTARLYQQILVRVPSRQNQAAVAALEARADSLRVLAQAGAPFDQLAKQFSQAASAAVGGRTRLLKRAAFPSEHQEAIWGLAPGAVTGVLATDDGYQLFRRPKPTEFRNEMIAELALVATGVADSTYIDSIVGASGLRLSPGVATRLRQLLDHPDQPPADSGFLGATTDGAIGAQETLVWLGNIPDQARAGLTNQSDVVLEKMAMTIAKNVVLYREAVRQGIRVDQRDLAGVTEEFRATLSKVVDQFKDATTESDVARRVDSLLRLAAGGVASAPLPAGLALLLREREPHQVFDQALRAVAAGAGRKAKPGPIVEKKAGPAIGRPRDPELARWTVRRLGASAGELVYLRPSQSIRLPATRSRPVRARSVD